MSDLLRWEPVDAEHPLTEADNKRIAENADGDTFRYSSEHWNYDGTNKYRAVGAKLVRILRPVTDPDGEWCEVSDAKPLTEADAGPRVRVKGKDWEFSGPAAWMREAYQFRICANSWTEGGVFRFSVGDPMDITHIYRPKPTRPTWKQISETEWDFGGQRLIKVFDKHFAWLSGVGNLDRSADDEVARMSVEEVWEHLNRKAPK